MSQKQKSRKLKGLASKGAERHRHMGKMSMRVKRVANDVTKLCGGESTEKAYGCYWIQLEEQKQSC